MDTSMCRLPQPQGLEWFLPLFYLKLLVSHLPTEEPYRPAAESEQQHESDQRFCEHS
jgi:hypothetical protein